MTAAAIRILVVDDHPAVRAGMQTMLEREPGIVVAATAATGGEAHAMWPALEGKPVDVVLVDHPLPDEDGLSLCLWLTTRAPAPAVVIAAATADEALALPAAVAGASAVWAKTSDPSGLPGILRAAVAGERGLPAGAPPGGAVPAGPPGPPAGGGRGGARPAGGVALGRRGAGRPPRAGGPADPRHAAQRRGARRDRRHARPGARRALDAPLGDARGAVGIAPRRGRAAHHAPHSGDPHALVPERDDVAAMELTAPPPLDLAVHSYRAVLDEPPRLAPGAGEPCQLERLAQADRVAADLHVAAHPPDSSRSRRIHATPSSVSAHAP